MLGWSINLFRVFGIQLAVHASFFILLAYYGYEGWISGGVLGMAWAGWGVPALPPLSIGYVNLLGAALIVPTSLLAAPFGVRLAHGISRRTLELAFAVLLLTVAARFLYGLLM